MLLIKMSLTEVDRHEGKESKTKNHRTTAHKDKQYKLLNHMSNLVRKSFPLETGKEGIWQF